MRISKLSRIIHAAFCEDRTQLIEGLPAWRYTRVNAPYALMPFGDDPRVLMPVNRQYSPLGVDDENWASYEPFAKRAIRFASDPKNVSGIWHPAYPYLFRLNPVNRGDYVARLTKLAALATDPAAARLALLLGDGGAA